jgi:hypothetical protein
MIKLKRSGQLIGQFGYMQFASNLKSMVAAVHDIGRKIAPS